MAMFHFRIKSDKKPDGTKVSAFKHVEYIRREGNFAEVENWEEKNKFVGNFISSTDAKNICDGQNFLLYKTDDFGSIRNSANGIEVTENFSPTTLAVALSIANKTMNHQPLMISSLPHFKQSVLQSALDFDAKYNAIMNLKDRLVPSRKERLYEMLLKIGVNTYRSFEKVVTLSVATVEQIIRYRNELFHEGGANDEWFVWRHLFPIVRTVIELLMKNPNLLK